MIRTVGFLGFGNMAQAMADGLLRAQALPAGRLLASAHHWERLQANTQRRGMVPCRDNRELAQKSDLIIAAVKPYLLEEVLAPLREDLRGKAVVSVAAGWTFDRLSQLLGEGVRCLCAMPNTPVSVGEGVILLEQDHSLTPGEYEEVTGLLAHLGTVEALPAGQMGIAGTLSGCGPAYAAMFLEALGDAGVLHGLPRALSYRLAAQMLAGAGKLQLETGAHPGAMKDAVCSPGGHHHRGRGGAGAEGLPGGCHRRHRRGTKKVRNPFRFLELSAIIEPGDLSRGAGPHRRGADDHAEKLEPPGKTRERGIEAAPGRGQGEGWRPSRCC